MRYQPQVNVAGRHAPAPDWRDCRPSSGPAYGPYPTEAEAFGILRFYDDGGAVLGLTHRVARIENFETTQRDYEGA